MQTIPADQFNQVILDSLPHWAMVIRSSTRRILSANKMAIEGGARVGGLCWESFQRHHSDQGIRCRPPGTEFGAVGDDADHCDFCQAGQSMIQRHALRRELKIENTVYDIWWVPVMEDIFLHYATDITELKKAETDRLKAARLESAVQTAAAACHELNQPLQVISAKLEMLLMDQGLPPEIEERLHELTYEVARMAAITAKLAKIGRYQTTEYLPGSTMLDLEGSSGN